eukprot:COSAG01_NODE_9183_length_2528_cov_1.254426_2_plen_315_part_00
MNPEVHAQKDVHRRRVLAQLQQHQKSTSSWHMLANAAMIDLQGTGTAASSPSSSSSGAQQQQQQQPQTVSKLTSITSPSGWLGVGDDDEETGSSGLRSMCLKTEDGATILDLEAYLREAAARITDHDELAPPQLNSTTLSAGVLQAAPGGKGYCNHSEQRLSNAVAAARTPPKNGLTLQHHRRRSPQQPQRTQCVNHGQQQQQQQQQHPAGIEASGQAQITATLGKTPSIAIKDSLLPQTQTCQDLGRRIAEDTWHWQSWLAQLDAAHIESSCDEGELEAIAELMQSEGMSRLESAANERLRSLRGRRCSNESI